MRYIIALALLVFVVSACSSAKQMTGADVIAAFKAAGLEAENTTEMQAKDYGLAPYVCKGTRFVIPSLGKDAIGIDQGGRVFICDSQDDLTKLRDYYVKIGQASAAFASHLYTKGPVLVQITNRLDKAIADKYGAALP